MTKKQDEQWGNIELPGLTDKELFTKNWNKVRNVSELVKQSEWKLNHAKGIADLCNSKIWREKTSNANKEKAYREDNRKAHLAGLEKRNSNPEFQKKLKENAEKRKKKVHTPDGIFNSRLEAAKHFKHGPSWILSQIKKFPNEWYYLT